MLQKENFSSTMHNTIATATRTWKNLCVSPVVHHKEV